MQTVGDAYSQGRSQAFRTLAIAASVLVYAAMLLYTGVHNWTLMLRGVPQEFVIWAVVGVLALEVSAGALPIALHWWCHAPLQRVVAFTFYGLDLALLWLNVVMDFHLNVGMGDLPVWATLYLTYIVPATPLIAGGGWSLLWMLDPGQRENAMVEQLRASTREALAQRVAQAARQTDIEELVINAAAQMARGVVASTLGEPMPRPGRSNYTFATEAEDRPRPLPPSATRAPKK